MMGRNSDLLDLLLELQTLDRIPRSGYSLRGIATPESVSEHSFHLVFLVWALATEVPELDLTRALELALIHDLAEVRTGDLPRSAAHYLPAGAKASAETAVAAELLAPAGERATDLFAEYQSGTTLEARFVTACDKLQLLIKTFVYESRGATGLDEFWEQLGGFPDGGFEVVGRIAQQLTARRHKEQG
ncbi:MAG: HD domain-containing protein [Thermoanaerobaculia bacterium]